MIDFIHLYTGKRENSTYFSSEEAIVRSVWSFTLQIVSSVQQCTCLTWNLKANGSRNQLTLQIHGTLCGYINILDIRGFLFLSVRISNNIWMPIFSWKMKWSNTWPAFPCGCGTVVSWLSPLYSTWLPLSTSTLANPACLITVEKVS